MRLTIAVDRLRDRHVVDKDPALELQTGRLAIRRLLEDRVALVALLPARAALLAAENDALEEVDVVLALRVVLDDEERLLEEQVAKGQDVVPLPVLDARGDIDNGLAVVLASLRLVDLVRHTHDGCESGLKLGVVRRRVGGVLDEVLKNVARQYGLRRGEEDEHQGGEDICTIVARV